MGFSSATYSNAVKALLDSAFGAFGATRQSATDAIAQGFLNSKGWNVQAFSQIGPGVGTTGFTFNFGGGTPLTVNGGTLLVCGFGSGWRPSTQALSTLSFQINGTTRATASMFFNTLAQHQALNPGIAVLAAGTIAAGSYSIAAVFDAGAECDNNDTAQFLVLEFPF